MKGKRHINPNVAFLVVLSLLITISSSSASKITRKAKIGTVRTKKTDSVKVSTNRQLKKKKKSNPHPRHSFDEVNSCLNYSCEELEALWRFPGKMPDCPGLNCNGSSVTSDSPGSGPSSGVSGGTSTSGESGNNSNHGGSGGHSNGENNNSYSEINDNNNENNYNNDGETSTEGGSGEDSDGEINYTNGENNENNSESNGGSYYRANDDEGSHTSEESEGSSSNGKNNDSSSESNFNYYTGNNNESYNDDTSDQTFDLNNCSTYSNYWLWDLNLSCQNSTSYEGCECTSAAMMLESGELQCPDGSESNPYCPRGCSICDTCLKLLGCAETRPENPFRTFFTLGLLWYAFAALLGVVLGIIAMTVHRRASQPTPMQQSLMRTSDDENVWLAPVD